MVLVLAENWLESKNPVGILILCYGSVLLTCPCFCLLLLLFLKFVPVYFCCLTTKKPTTVEPRRLYENLSQMQYFAFWKSTLPTSFWMIWLSFSSGKERWLFSLGFSWRGEIGGLETAQCSGRSSGCGVRQPTVGIRTPTVLLASYVNLNVNLISSCLSFLTRKGWGPGRKVLCDKSSHNVIMVVFLETADIK